MGNLSGRVDADRLIHAVMSFDGAHCRRRSLPPRARSEGTRRVSTVRCQVETSAASEAPVQADVALNKSTYGFHFSSSRGFYMGHDAVHIWGAKDDGGM